jgi:inner membrane protein
MDNLCHTLAGAALGEAGLKWRTRFGNPVLMIAANLPDVDAAVFLTGTPSVAFRRGWTHGVLAQAVLPILLTAIVLAIDRWRPPGPAGAPGARAAPLLALSYVGVISHVLLDCLNNYGVRLLMPFSNRWFYGDAVFIVDPWLWLALGAGVLFARRLRRPYLAGVAIAVAIAYIGMMVWLAIASREAVLEAWQAQHGSTPRALMVGPVPVAPFRKAVIADTGDRYERGVFDWQRGRLQMTGSLLKRGNEPAVRRARERPAFRAILRWARFPYYVLEHTPGGTRVTLQDARFGRQVGSATVMVPDD